MNDGEILALVSFAGLALMAALAGTDPDEKRARAKRSGRGVRAQHHGPNRAHAQALAHNAQLALTWPGLAGFLDLFAHRESRWHPSAGKAKVGTNGAIGLYQLRPTSAFPPREFQWSPKVKADRRRIVVEGGPALLDPAINTAAIVRYIASLHRPGRTWLDVAVGGAYPIFARGRPTRDEYQALSATGKIRTRFPTYEQWLARYDAGVGRAHKSARAVGLPDDFLQRPAYPPGWGGSWRGSFRDRGVRTLTILLGGDVAPLP